MSHRVELVGRAQREQRQGLQYMRQLEPRHFLSFIECFYNIKEFCVSFLKLQITLQIFRQRKVLENVLTTCFLID